MEVSQQSMASTKENTKIPNLRAGLVLHSTIPKNSDDARYFGQEDQ
jgi:hypothetical protein